ncbi:hypothetical protein [Streptomyces niveus]|uniref:hypothetical protein n=1 Tax=Streptomyces niveus TaxID=193462 RepID=UPI003650A23A
MPEPGAQLLGALLQGLQVARRDHDRWRGLVDRQLGRPGECQREVAALTGFTRIEAPEWLAEGETQTRPGASLSRSDPTWVPCAELRGEGVFLALNEQRLTHWERQEAVIARERMLQTAHRDWCAARRIEPHWPGIRYVLLHTLAHVLIRQFALEMRIRSIRNSGTCAFRP